jgi:hypothetical protein
VEMVTADDGVHRHGVGGAPRGAIRCHCHCHFSVESEGSGHGHRLGTEVPRAMHHPIFLKGKGFAGLARVVTTTPGAVPLPSLSRWNSTVGKGTAMSGALIETSSFAPMALFGLGAINRGGAQPWASC